METLFAMELKTALKNICVVVARPETYDNMLYLLLAFPWALSISSC